MRCVCGAVLRGNATQRIASGVNERLYVVELQPVSSTSTLRCSFFIITVISVQANGDQHNNVNVYYTGATSWDNAGIIVGAGADLGFYKGVCQIHLKEAPEVESRRHRGGWIWGVPLPRKFSYFLYQNGEFLCIPGDSHWHINDVLNIIFFFQKGHPNQRAGVRTPWTPPGSATVG